MSYDVLVVGVGTVNNTFGIKGVEQYCHSFKSIEAGLGRSTHPRDTFSLAPPMPSVPLPICPPSSDGAVLPLFQEH